MDDLRALPKAHLHLHLVGSMRPATLAELALRAGRAVPDVRLDAGAPTGWARFDARYRAAKDLLTEPGDLVRLVHELAEDEAAAGSGWVEVTANPGLYGGRFGTDADVLDLLLDAGSAAGAATGVGIGWVVSADRRHPRHAVGLARLAVSAADRGVVGFGLANDEAANPGAAFADAFCVARDGGLRSVPHAGELCGAHEVAAAVDLLGADRIGHGVRAVEDPRLLERLATDGTALEVCPSSKLALGVCRRAEDHPLPRLLEAGVTVSLAADDPLLFGSGLVEQYALARDAFGLSDSVLADLAAASVEASCAPTDVRARLLAGVAAWRAPAAAAA